MSLDELSQMTADIQRHLEMIQSLLSLYAGELQRVVDAKIQKTHELAQATARLRLLDRLKADFLTFISHELRTPLNGMVAINLLDPQGDPQEQAEIIALIRRSCS